MERIRGFLEKRKKKKFKHELRPIQEPDQHGPAMPFLSKKFKRIGLIIGQDHFKIEKGGKEKFENINGPSLIKVPDWVDDPLGKYYLYFAHHRGKYIRLACSERIEGPYTLHEPGTLKSKDHAIDGVGHVASPDVLIQEEKQEIWMYYHLKTKQETRFQGRLGNQFTYLATSTDGVNFKPGRVPLCGAYFRAFQHDGAMFGVGKGQNQTLCIYRSPDGMEPFMPGATFIEGRRHPGILKIGNALHVFYSKTLDVPERIYYITVDISSPDWETWMPKEEKGTLILYPEEPWEGADLPFRQPSSGSAYHRLRQLRDPQGYEENGKIYLLYSVAGEYGIGLARLEP